MATKHRFEVTLTVEDEGALNAAIELHNKHVDRGIAAGIVSDDPSEWDWFQLMTVYDDEMAGEDAFEVTNHYQEVE